MLSDAKLVAFAATANCNHAKEFYTNVLGLRELDDTPFALVFEANGTILRIQKVESVVSSNYTMLGWEVIDIQTMVETLKSKGVQFLRFDALSQDNHGIWESPDGAKIAWFKDPDGNTLSITQVD